MTNHDTITKDGKALVKDTLERSIYAKKELCKEEPMTDNPGILFFVAESNETNPEHEACLEYQAELGLDKPYHVAMVPLIHKEDVVDCLEDIVRAMPVTKFDYLIIAVEGYSRSQESPEYERGSMEEEFRTNPFTDVREGIIITAIDWSATTLFSNIATYTYDDVGVPQFDEPMELAQKVTEESEMGRIPDTLISICRYMDLAFRATKFHELLTQKDRPSGGEVTP